MKKLIIRAVALLFVICLTVALASCDMLPAEITALLGGNKECQHTNVEWIVDKEASCRAEGKKHSVCLDCDAALESDVVIPLAEHKLGDWEIEAESTCNKAGSRYRKCSACKRKVEVEELPLSPTHEYLGGKCSVCSAVQPVSTGLAYSYSTAGEATVTGMGTCTDTSIVIPETAPNGTPVRAIGDAAFKGKAINSVIVPDCITSVASNAFEGCNIVKASIPAAFCSTVKCTALNWITITGTGAIPESALTGAASLESVVISEGITEIRESAFNGCKKLSYVILPNSLVTIGKLSFSACTSLVGIELGPNVVTIGDRAFYNSTRLLRINIPASVRLIGINAFSCPHDSLTGLGNDSRLVNVEFEVTTGWYAVASPTNIAGEAIAPEVLEDNATAAAALNETYRTLYIKHV